MRTFVVREGVHGEWCVDEVRVSYDRIATVGRAATHQDAERIVRALNDIHGASKEVE
jgi:hypothetical protein